MVVDADSDANELFRGLLAPLFNSHMPPDEPVAGHGGDSTVFEKGRRTCCLAPEFYIYADQPLGYPRTMHTDVRDLQAYP